MQNNYRFVSPEYAALINPNMLPEIKKIIRSVKYSEARRIAKRVLKMKTESEIREFLRSVMKKKFPDIPIN